MDVRFKYKDTHLSSLRQINALPEAIKLPFYRSLIPNRILTKYHIALQALHGQHGAVTIQVHCQKGTSSIEIDIRHLDAPRDPLLYVQMADTVSGQLEVVLLIINDPFAPRFDIDRDWKGECTKLGTMTRNISAEVEAMEAGLAPGQVRRGLRLTRDLIPVMQEFATGLGKDRFFIEPLTYNSAIMFERYGFAYMVGRTKMEQIHLGFQPGGKLYEQLDGTTPFRQRSFGKTIRGRSWAIHDGILGEPWSGVKMYKRTGCHAGICTFPNATY